MEDPSPAPLPPRPLPSVRPVTAPCASVPGRCCYAMPTPLFRFLGYIYNPEMPLEDMMIVTELAKHGNLLGHLRKQQDIDFLPEPQSCVGHPKTPRGSFVVCVPWGWEAATQHGHSTFLSAHHSTVLQDIACFANCARHEVSGVSQTCAPRPRCPQRAAGGWAGRRIQLQDHGHGVGSRRRRQH